LTSQFWHRQASVQQTGEAISDATVGVDVNMKQVLACFTPCASAVGDVC